MTTLVVSVDGSENSINAAHDGRMDQVMGMTQAWLVSHMEIPGVQVSSRMF
jgi:hypothetical protein